MKIIIITLIPVISLVVGIIAIPKTAKTQVISDLINASDLTSWQRFPFNFRPLGYNQSDLEQYWRVLQADENALDSEQKALEIDLWFPLIYGLTTLVSSLYFWYQLNQPFSWLFVISPMTITMIADWIENTTTLKQLAQFRASNPLDASQISIASVATQVKLASFVFAYLILFYLAIKSFN